MLSSFTIGMSMGQFWRALAPQGYNLYPAAGVCPRTACQSLQMQWSTCFYEILTWCNDPSNLVAMLSLWHFFACCAIIVCPNAYKSHSTPLRLIRGSVTNGAGWVMRQSLYGRIIIIDKWDASQAKHLITISSQQDLKAAFVTSRNLSSLLKTGVCVFHRVVYRWNGWRLRLCSIAFTPIRATCTSQYILSNSLAYKMHFFF